MQNNTGTVGQMEVFDFRYINPDDAWIVDGVLQISKDSVTNRNYEGDYCLQITRMPHNYHIHNNPLFNFGGLDMLPKFKAYWPQTKATRPEDPVDIQY